MMWLSRDTFYRDKSALEEDDVEALLDKTQRTSESEDRIDDCFDSQLRVEMKRDPCSVCRPPYELPIPAS